MSLKYGLCKFEGLEVQITKPANTSEKDRNCNPITFVSATAKSLTPVTEIRKRTNLETGKEGEVAVSAEKDLTFYADAKEFPEAFAELRRAPIGSIVRVDFELDSVAHSKPGRSGGVFTDKHGRCMVTAVKIVELASARA